MNDQRDQESVRGGTDPHLDEDTCLDLMHGLLAAPQRAAALEHLATCPACEQALRAMAARQERTRASWRLVATPSGPQLENTTEAARDHTPPVDLFWLRRFARSLTLRMAVAGAVAVLALALVWPRDKGPGHGGLDTALKVYPLPVHVEGTRVRAPEEGGDPSALTAGLDAYASGSYIAAAQALRDAPTAAGLEAIRNVYLGSALALSGRFEGAVDVLSAIDLDQLPDPWGAESMWTLLVAYRASKMGDRADSILIRLARDQGDVGDRARSVLAGRARGGGQ